MKTILICAATALLSGCTAMKIDLSNRIVRTEACDEMLVVSKWTRWFGFSFIVDARDAEATLKKCKADQAATK